VLRRIQVQTHHIAQLLNEQWIGREFEALNAVRFELKDLEVACHRALADARLAGKPASTPVRRAVGGFGVQRLVDQLGHSFIIPRSGAPWTKTVVQPPDTGSCLT